MGVVNERGGGGEDRGGEGEVRRRNVRIDVWRWV